ncbi:MAG: hypothetical protein NTW96_16540, partial [Planctomycetia bacterium]|nr:hypothetical protein [Planctomycetia bacterium]
MFNAMGFVLNYIRHDPETAVCYFQYAEQVNLCGLANTIFLLQATLTTTWDHYIILGCEAGFVRADQEDEYGVYHSESMQTVGASWYLDSDCSAFDKTKTGLGNAGSIYGYWWAST